MLLQPLPPLPLLLLLLLTLPALPAQQQGTQQLAALRALCSKGGRGKLEAAASHSMKGQRLWGQERQWHSLLQHHQQ